MALGALRRWDLDEEFVAVAARAIRLRHPGSKRLMTLKAAHLDDEGLIEVVMRLTRWCDEKEGG